MLESIPYLHQFSRLYWNQMGDEVFGTIENAFQQFLRDAERFPDRGSSIRRSLLGELMLILSSPQYGAWLQAHRTNRSTIRAVGGRFIRPDDVEPLLAVLDERSKRDS